MRFFAALCAPLGLALAVCGARASAADEDLAAIQLRGTLRVAAVKAPGYGDRRKAMLEDIAILTNGKAVT